MKSMKAFLLASSALFAAASIVPVQAGPAPHALTVAQAQSENTSADKQGDSATAKKKNDDKKKADEANKKDKNDKKKERKASKQDDDKKNGEKAKKGAPPNKADAAPPKPSTPASAAQQKQSAPADKPAPAAAAEKKTPPPVKKKAPPPAKQAAPDARPDTKQAAPAAQPAPKQQPAAEQKQQPAARQKQPEQKQAEPKQQPAEQQKQAEPKQQPAEQQKQAQPQQQPAEQQKPSQPATRQAAPADSQVKPAPSKSAAPAPGGDSDAASAAAQRLEPAKPQDSREFIRKGGAQPERTIKDVRQQRRTTQEQDGRTLILEGDRIIVRDPNRTFIRHNEDRRFAIGARTVRTDRRNGETFTVILRPNGVRIITVTDRQGHLVRRVRRNPNGQEVVIIDNRHAGRRDVFLDVRPPRIGMPRNRYIMDADRANRREIYDLLIAPPVQTIERDYSLAQVRYNAPLREYMRRLDLDIHFETGSWQITPEQMDRLSVVAEALNRAIERNPREVFLIEGHTDAVGSEEDNLSLSDRRAESVAVALTEVFKVPPENLVTQGYGEQELKVDTEEPSRANRRVAMRRITPLINRTARR